MKKFKERFPIFGFFGGISFMILGFYQYDFRWVYFGFAILFTTLIFLMEKDSEDNEIVKAEYDSVTEIMYITRRNGKTDKYSGSGTIWYSLPEFERVNTSMDLELSRLLDYNKKFGIYKKPL